MLAEDSPDARVIWGSAAADATGTFKDGKRTHLCHPELRSERPL